MEIKTIQTGSTIVSTAVPDRSTRRSPIAYTGLFQRRDSRITVPVKCFYVSVRDHHFLVDAGWSKEVIHHPKKHLGAGLYFASVPVMQGGEAAVDQLKNQPLDRILMTHLDCDHISGLHDFKNIPIYSSKEEIDGMSKKKIRYGNMAKGLSIQTLQWESDTDALFGKSCDVYGDGSVIAYLTPTHSPGSVIYQITDRDHFALIIGDNGYTEDSWKKGLLPGPLYHAENMKKALRWINEQSKKDNCAGIFCAHDPVDRNYDQD